MQVKTEIVSVSWEELLKMKVGTILKDWYDEGVRCIIMRGPCSLCAYLGVPLNHPLAGFHYDDLPVKAHGGLTYAGEGKGNYPEGFYWYGWDYSHAWDQSFYETTKRDDRTQWGLKEVEGDMWDSIYDFKHLIKLTEAISKKTKGK